MFDIVIEETDEWIKIRFWRYAETEDPQSRDFVIDTTLDEHRMIWAHGQDPAATVFPHVTAHHGPPNHAQRNDIDSAEGVIMVKRNSKLLFLITGNLTLGDEY